MSNSAKPYGDWNAVWRACDATKDPKTKLWKVEQSRGKSCQIEEISSAHTRCIVKTSGFTRGVCRNRGFYSI